MSKPSPTLMDLEGSALFLSTPNGIANYFYSLYLRGPGPEREDWASFQAFDLGESAYPEIGESNRRART